MTELVGKQNDWLVEPEVSKADHNLAFWHSSCWRQKYSAEQSWKVKMRLRTKALQSIPNFDSWVVPRRWNRLWKQVT